MSPARPASHRRALAWTAALSVPLLAGAALLVPMAASGAVDLPDKTVEELLEFAAASDVDALSGTIEQSSELGLPDLGGLMGIGRRRPRGGSTAADIEDFIALATGTHTANVFLDGERARLQVLDQLAERNVYLDGEAEEAWYVDSETQTATRFTPPSDAELEQSKGEAEAAAPKAEEALPTPDQMLDQALARLDETTEVTVGTDARVAGRDVYELILAAPHRRHPDRRHPVRDRRRERHGARRVGHCARSGRAGVRGRLHEGRASRPRMPRRSPSRRATTSPWSKRSSRCRTPTSGRRRHAEGDAADAERPTVVGEGWSAVVELPTMSETANVFAELDAGAARDARGASPPTSTADGCCRPRSSAVLITDDGRVLAGAVPADAARRGRPDRSLTALR